MMQLNLNSDIKVKYRDEKTAVELAVNVDAKVESKGVCMKPSKKMVSMRSFYGYTIAPGWTRKQE